jgi:RNA polymerase sigma factor (sigma-70 family)
LPEEEAVSVEEQRLARAFVDGLPARERDLLALRFEQRLTQAQAGAALGLSRQNVRTMEGRLHRKIKDFLKTLR